MWKEFVKWLAQKYIKDAEVHAASDAIAKYREEQELSRKHVEEIQYQGWLGKTIIYTSNEWENPVIGKVVRIVYITKAVKPVLMVADLISGEELMILTNQVYEYSPEMLKAVMLLNPYQRWNIKSFNSQIDFNKQPPVDRKPLLKYSDVLYKIESSSRT